MIRCFIVGGLLAASFLLAPGVVTAQTPQQAADYNALLTRYLSVRPTMPAAQRTRIETMFGTLRARFGLDRSQALQPLQARRPVGRLSTNPYLPGSTAAPSSTYDADSPTNPYGTYGSQYAPNGATNPYSTGGLEVYGEDGTYLGRLNSNRYDPESVANPYGRYGSQYSPNSVNNPYGRYGSPYSPYSATNPYATQAPRLYTPESSGPGYSLPPLPTLPSLELPTLPPLWPDGR